MSFAELLFIATVFTTASAACSASESSVVVKPSKDGHHVDISTNGRVFTESLSGYSVADCLEDDLGNNGVQVVLFLDVQGISIGGNLRVFAITSDRPEEIPNEYSGNRISLESAGSSKYIVLWQHDTKDFYYVSKLLVLDGQTIRESKAADGWKKLIHDEYEPHIAAKSDDFTISRYLYYTGLAYLNIGERQLAKEYFLKAKNLDPTNVQIDRELTKIK